MFKFFKFQGNFVFIYFPLTLLHRLKRENTKLSAADALALLELIEAQEEQQQEALEQNYNPYQYLTNVRDNGPELGTDNGWLNTWTEPRMQLMPGGYANDYFEQPADRFFKNRGKTLNQNQFDSYESTILFSQ